jgi:hypothetical protein
MFWQVVASFDQGLLSQLLRFITGHSVVPAGGASVLGKKIQIEYGGGEDAFPVAHTCRFQLDLPEYKSIEMMRSRILRALKESADGEFHIS